MKRGVGVCAFLIVVAMTSVTLAAGKCGWDIHAAPNFEKFELGERHSLLFYSAQSTLVMDDTKDPMHLLSGVCKGMGIAEGEKLTWSGACSRTDATGDRFVDVWGADTAPKPGEPLRGWSKGGQDNTGKFAALKWSGTWTALPKGGSRFCADY